MECTKCHLIYKEEDTKKFTCDHIICKTCFYNVIIKDLINNINNNNQSYSINCKCNKGTITFIFDELKNIKLPSNFEETKTCAIHDNNIFLFYDKVDKKLLCNKCNENPKNKDHEKIKIDDLKINIKNKTSDIPYKTYEEFQKYIKKYFGNFIENSKKYYQEEISKMEKYIEKIKQMEKDIKKQMEEQIEKEKVLFNLIDILYKKNYDNLKILNNNSESNKYGYRFYKQLSKVKFDFGEFGTEHQEEIIPEIDRIIKDFDENISKKRFKTNIKYPYFELIKSFSQINDYKQDAIISCIAANNKNNEFSVGYRDYSIKIFQSQGSNYESYQTLNKHRGEISSLLYVDNYLVSGSKDKTLKIWEQDINNNNFYKLKQIIKISDKEIKKLNIYVNEPNIGFLVTSEESSFRLFLKKSENDKKEKKEEEEKKEEKEKLNSMDIEENEKKEGENAEKCL